MFYSHTTCFKVICYVIFFCKILYTFVKLC